MAKKLKYWNGRGQAKYFKDHINVAAYSQKQAAELINEACNAFITVYEIKTYFSNCWGNSMKNVTTNEPGVWIENTRGKIKKII